MKNEIELWKEPLIGLWGGKEFICEMTTLDHEILCGMLRKCKPKKILEIGVAEGGTTAVVVNALSMLGIRCEMWSVDLNENLYNDSTRCSGYIYENMKYKLDMSNVKHYFLFGGTIADYIEKIGNQIDFAIIDTVHFLPGEILDFLCILPYLSEHAMVMLHDVNLNYYRMVNSNSEYRKRASKAISTKLLLDAVKGEKYYFRNGDNMANIAAFTVNKDTIKYVEDVFYALTFTWNYLPSDKQVEGYRKIFTSFYDKDCIDCFEIAVRSNRDINEIQVYLDFVEYKGLPKGNFVFPYSIIEKGSKIALYGAGNVGKDFYGQIKNYYDVVLWVDCNYKAILSESDISKISISEPELLYTTSYDYVVVAIAEESIAKGICKELIDKGIKKEMVIWKIPWRV
jgi:predicted O-methyltransferase YrrM